MTKEIEMTNDDDPRLGWNGSLFAGRAVGQLRPELQRSFGITHSSVVIDSTFDIRHSSLVLQK